MHTYQIAQKVLENYRNEKLGDERLAFLQQQAKEQLEEMAQNSELYSSFLEQVNAPENVDSSILWILLMSNESIVEEYIDEYSKSFREIIPVSDLADLLLYNIHLAKVKKTPLEGFDYLLAYDTDGMIEVDQYAFTNALLYIQQSKEVPIQF